MSYPLPEPSPGALSTTLTERRWALASHVGTFATGWACLGLLAPLVVLAFMGRRSVFVRKHAVESLIFQISLLVYLLLGAIFTIGTLFVGLFFTVPAGILIAIVGLISIIRAAVKAHRGERFRYPFCIRLG